ncbi:MAG: hypothetical protein JW828_02815 [Sedimentisphaerales bacterium]|nr:hypothetical protein [Sedimentisphaerales bacterium]
MDMNIRSLWLLPFLFLMILALHGPIFAEVMFVDLTLVPPSAQINRLDTSFSVTVGTATVTDTDSTDVTGNVLSEVEVFFDPSHQPNVVTAVTFNGGRIDMTDLSYRLSFSFLGNIFADGTGIAATVFTPSPPGTVVGNSLELSEHVVVLNEGAVSAYGTGIIGTQFDPMSADFSQEPIEATMEGQGQIEVILDHVQNERAYYRVVVALPLSIDHVAYEDPELGITVRLGLSGTLQAEGWFSRCVAALCADLTGDGCVDAEDVRVLSDQWLAVGDPGDCPLTAELTGGECYVDLFDLAVFADSWLVGCPL